jgi:quinol monooxygenase YgiN
MPHRRRFDPSRLESHMPITALLELRVTPEALDHGVHAEMHAILSDTRAFEGCLGVEVLIDAEDPMHFVAVERWASEEHDAAYRAWRAGDGQTNLASFLASPPVLTKFAVADAI